MCEAPPRRFCERPQADYDVAELAMWWRSQHLSESRKDSGGRKWNFRVWHDVVDGKAVERVFFWDDLRTETGAIEFVGDQTLHVTRLRQLIEKLVKQPKFRAKHRRGLRFPVERAYREYAPLD
jgi:hypothetical protein